MYRESFFFFFFPLCSFRNNDETPGQNRRNREYLRNKGYCYFRFCYSIKNNHKKREICTEFIIEPVLYYKYRFRFWNFLVFFLVERGQNCYNLFSSLILNQIFFSAHR